MGTKLLLLGILIVVGGLVSLALAYITDRNDKRLQQWPQTMGLIVSSQVVRTAQARLRAPAYSMSPPPEPTYRIDDVWALRVLYGYSVDGIEHKSSRATSSLLVENVKTSGASPSERLRSLAAALAPGSRVPVHYDPADPRESYLVFIDTPGKARLLTTGAFCVAVGLVLAAAGRLIAR